MRLLATPALPHLTIYAQVSVAHRNPHVTLSIFCSENNESGSRSDEDLLVLPRILLHSFILLKQYQSVERQGRVVWHRHELQTPGRRCVGVKLRAQSPTWRHDAVDVLGQEAHRLAPLRSRMISPPHAHAGTTTFISRGFKGHGADADERDGRAGDAAAEREWCGGRGRRGGRALGGTNMGGSVVTPFMAGVGATALWGAAVCAAALRGLAGIPAAALHGLEPAPVERRAAVAVIVLPTWADTDTVKRGVLGHVQSLRMRNSVTPEIGLHSSPCGASPPASRSSR
ncbi:hypothetical protein C8J57DRAFT_1470050 [Mycena rebaudengoi]|nr:hypothetical protein C8J57DRAFT_1470050 [Mycena rebaudengoi]